MHKHSVKPLALAIPLALVGVFTLSGCAALDGSGFTGRLVFDDKSEAAHESSADIPSWVPDDASTIVIDYIGDHGDYLMKFASSNGIAASKTCVALAGDAPLTPAISTDWWPKESLTDGRLRCGDAELARLGDEWYAWVKA
ncbi:hypothetical protein PU630_02055 [Microbacterium horticulturae]|uniref:Lipoprotein n=1 Tax=Microbacterium horticulturae TaxID=3028316 RepID=A0ABY8C3F8_9MICO|nr:hypothetical protein [Microbacterium sp. KACC 23027]WEG09373.1 hypothetical protein PU630_02055 [Microbacterium sp. KACC 23027]